MCHKCNSDTFDQTLQSILAHIRSQPMSEAHFLRVLAKISYEVIMTNAEMAIETGDARLAALKMRSIAEAFKRELDNAAEQLEENDEVPIEGFSVYFEPDKWRTQ